MSYCLIKVNSKNLVSLTVFEKFLLKLKKKLRLDFFFTKKYQKTKKKKFTILKSPHVNKTAQEQFEQNFFCTSLKIKTTEINKLFFVIKRLKNKIFFGISLKTKINLYNQSILLQTQLNLDHYYLKMIKNNINTKTKIYLTILDMFGELAFKNK